MACDTLRLPGQTLAQRVEEVRTGMAVIDRLIAAGQVKVKVGPQGAVTFTGITDVDRRRMTDACIYRSLSRSGSAAAKMALRRAEQTAGRAIDRKVVGHGVHSHDGGKSWSTH